MIEKKRNKKTVEIENGKKEQNKEGEQGKERKRMKKNVSIEKRKNAI